MKKSISQILIIAIGLLVILSTLGIGLGIKSYINTRPEVPGEIQKPEAPQLKEGFLYGKGNKPVNLFDQNDNRMRIVYFGFTHCPDICPTSLAMLAGALNQLDEKTVAHLRPVFITLDPERDNGDDSYQYAQYFHKSIEGLSAPLDVTKPLANKYGVTFRKTDLKNSELDYTLDHSSYFYFMRPDGTLITKVPHTESPAPIVDAIKTLTDSE